MPYLIRAEGVNLSAVLSDTSDLSTIRGGGLMLLEAASELAPDVSKKRSTPVTVVAKDCKAKSTGASAALLWCGDKSKAKAALADVRKHLQGENYKHFTFVVNALEYDARGKSNGKLMEYQQAEAAVLAANRWQQMQAPSLAIPSLTTGKSNAVCEVDRVRPTFKDDSPFPDNQKKSVSQSVHVRRERGRTLRQDIYPKEMERLAETKKAELEKIAAVKDLEFTDDLHSLAEGYPDAGNLEDKFAVLYMDGNNFGAIARACNNDEELNRWDSEIKRLRRTLLLEILLRANADPRWHFMEKKEGKNKKLIRLETLLWGGDELIFAVPAWLGFPLLDFIFEHTQNWKYGKNDLTHGVGLVFCHVKAPIQRVIDLAKRLGEEAKMATGRKQNAVCWLAMESFDHVGTDFNVFMERRYHKTIGAKHWVLTAGNVNAINANLRQLKENDFPRSQVMAGAMSAVHLASPATSDKSLAKTLKNAYAQVRASAGKAEASDELLALWNHLKGVNGEQEKAFPDDFPKVSENLEHSANAERLSHIAAWVQFAELWDYAGQKPLVAAPTQGRKS